MQEGIDDLHPDLFLHLVHAAHVLEGNARPLGRGERLVVGERLQHPFIVSVERHGPLHGPLGKFLVQVLVGQRRISGHGLLVGMGGLAAVAAFEEDLGVQEVRAGRRVRPRGKLLEHQQRRRKVALPEGRVSKAGLDLQVLRREQQQAAVFLVRLVEQALGQERFGKVPAQGEVVGREPHRLPQGLQCIVFRGHSCFRS